MVCDSGSDAEAVAMVVPVAIFSAKDDAANVFERLGASLTSSTVIINSNEVVLTPSDAFKVKV